MEPHKTEVRVRNSDIAEFGTKQKGDTDLGQYVDKRPNRVHKKTSEQNVNNHKEDLLRKDIGSKKIKRSRKQPDDINVIYNYDHLYPPQIT